MRDVDVLLRISQPASDGSFVVLRMPVSSRLLLRFHDDASTRDHTDWAADFALLGWAHENPSLHPEPAGAVEVAEVLIDGCDPSAVEGWWISAASQRYLRCDAEALLAHISRGVAVQIANAVASQILADGGGVPDTTENATG